MSRNTVSLRDKLHIPQLAQTVGIALVIVSFFVKDDEKKTTVRNWGIGVFAVAYGAQLLLTNFRAPVPAPTLQLK